MRQRYLIALGSNKRHHRYGGPRQVLRAAIAALAAAGVTVEAAAPIVTSAPLGPSLRRYANSAALIATDLAPDELLDLLKRIEGHFGRRAGGQRHRPGGCARPRAARAGGRSQRRDLRRVPLRGDRRRRRGVPRPRSPHRQLRGQPRRAARARDGGGRRAAPAVAQRRQRRQTEGMVPFRGCGRRRCGGLPAAPRL